MKPKHLFLLLLVISIGAIVRLWGIGHIPPGLDWDERSIGYNAFSIAVWGKDEWGKNWPLVFSAFGDFKLPLYIYLTAVAVKFLGLNAFSVKLVALLSGIISVPAVYALTQVSFKKRKLSATAALLAALAPYSVFYSHVAQETILASTLIIAAILAEVVYIRNKKMLSWLVAVLFLSLSLFAYNTARVVSPLFMLIFAAVNLALGKENKIKTVFALLTILVFGLAVTGLQFKIGGFSRFKETGIFGPKKGIVMEIDELRYHDRNDTVAKLLHNKPLAYILKITEHYVTHFSPDFLFFFRSLDVVQESFYPPLFLISLPFYYFGLFALAKNAFKSPDRTSRAIALVLLTWILLSPLPSAITEGSPSSKRWLAGFGSMEIAAAYGFWLFMELKKSAYRWKYIIAGAYLMQLAAFIIFFFHTMPDEIRQAYRTQNDAIAQYIKENYGRFDKIIYSSNTVNQPQIYPLFSLAYPPEKYYREKKWTYASDGWYWIDGFGKFSFYGSIDNSVISALPAKGKILLMVSRKELSQISLPQTFSRPTLIMPDEGKMRDEFVVYAVSRQ